MMPDKKKELSLREKMLNHITLRTTGVSVSEMETAFGESRMKIGFVAKKLHEEGRIDKVDSLYFPKNISNIIIQHIEPELFIKP